MKGARWARGRRNRREERSNIEEYLNLMPGPVVRKLGADLLFHAIVHGNTQDAVALLEDNEVDLHARNVNGLTPLHVNSSITAVRSRDRPPHVRRNAAQIRRTAQHPGLPRNRNGHSTLQSVREEFSRGRDKRVSQIAELLLLFNADPTISNKNGFTALHIAARHGHIDIVNLLVNKGETK